MDLQQARILLEKITSLQKSIALNKGPMASIERDLMLSYIRQLYEVYMGSEEPAEAAKISRDNVNEETKVAPKPVEVEQPRQTYTPPPSFDETVKPPKADVPVQNTPPPPPHQPEPKIEVKQETPPPPPPVQRSGSSNQKNFSALFEMKQARELSEKLSERPVTDLTKAFAINDKLLYINELFGRDAESFNETLKILNKFERMEEATSLLMSLAEQYNWTEEDRLEIAQSFIKTVRRKYV